MCAYPYKYENTQAACKIKKWMTVNVLCFPLHSIDFGAHIPTLIG